MPSSRKLLGLGVKCYNEEINVQHTPQVGTVKTFIKTPLIYLHCKKE
jgi:hypothetical protein